MTLIELLVVVAIVVTLLATAVPMMQPALRDARVRESARQLNVFCAVAKGRARELGRPVGIWLDRAATGGNAVSEIHIAETPQPYSGDYVFSKAQLVDVNGDGLINQRDILPVSPGPDGIADDEIRLAEGENAFALSVIKAGDHIRFDTQGPSHRITSIYDPDPMVISYYVIKIAVAGGVSAPLPAPSGTSYTVIRQPVKSSLQSLQLSGGAVVDLQYSGIGASNVMFDAQLTNRPAPDGLNGLPVIIMFDPAGSVERVYTRYRVTPSAGNNSPVAYDGTYANAAIYLLVGRFDQTSPPPDPSNPLVMPLTTAEQTNVEDESAVWISIGARTGRVSSAENVRATTVDAARVLARSAQSMGGN